MHIKQKKQAQAISLCPLFSPYGTGALSNLYAAYCADPDRILEQNGDLYYRVLEVAALGDHQLLLLFSNELSLKIGDTLVDENGSLYPVIGMEMFRRDPNAEFDASLHIISVLTERPDVKSVGQYFCRFHKLFSQG